MKVCCYRIFEVTLSFAVLSRVVKQGFIGHLGLSHALGNCTQVFLTFTHQQINSLVNKLRQRHNVTTLLAQDSQ